MKIVDLITKDGFFNYSAFYKLDSDQQKYLIDLYKTFLETYSGLNFVFTECGFRAISPEDQQEYYCRNYFSDDYSDEVLDKDVTYFRYFSILEIQGVAFIEPRFNSMIDGASYFIANYEEI